AAVLVSVVPKRGSCTDGATVAEHTSYQQLSSKQHQEQWWKQQQHSLCVSSQQSPSQPSPSRSTRALRQPSRHCTGSVSVYCSMEDCLDGGVNLAAIMQQQQQQQRTAAGAAAAVSVATGVEDSSSACLPVSQGRTSPLRCTAAAASSDSASTASLAGNEPPAVQQQKQQQQQQRGSGPPGVHGKMSSAGAPMSLQGITCSDAAAAQPARAGTSSNGMHIDSSSERNSSGSTIVSGGVAVSGIQAVPLATTGAPQPPDVHSWVAGLSDNLLAAIALQQCAERVSAAEIEVSDALKYPMDLGSHCCGSNSAAAGAAAGAPQLERAGICDAAAVTDGASSKDRGGLPVTAIVLEQQEMLRRFKAFKGRLSSSEGPAPALRPGGSRLSIT
ncbi:hypothetical protein COO60DRAFT_1475851, partial [Scenedesmus sp. NREL 46B-D3]